MSKMLITGVSGFLGSWCMQQALEAGYEVIGTVRDPNSKKCSFLRDAMEGKSMKISSKAATHLKLVKADLLDGDEAWNAVFAAEENIQYVLHTASPYFTKEPADPNDYIRPACQGTESVLRAAVRHNVKKVVVTSSVASIYYPMVNHKTYTSQDWSDASSQNAYGKSKTLAEQTAWDIVQGTDVELAAVCPFLIMGPTLYDDKDMLRGFESGEMCVKFMSGKVPAVARMKAGISDVRDVAQIHVLTLQVPGAMGQRYISSSQPYWLKDVASMFKEGKPDLKISNIELPSWLVRVLALCNPDLQRMKRQLDIDYSFDNSSLSKILGLELTPAKKTLLDMMDDVIELGAVPAIK